uniref:Ataxin 1 n=1 Tax=Hippocampus comes TaxID=109280 RepID=A0A3Q3E0X3_HIPCM
MKSNQERSNGCLPPKKREILALEQRPVAVTTSTPPVVHHNPAPHTENLAWLASVASERCRSRDSESPRCPIPSTSSSSPPTIPTSATTLSAVPLASLPAVYPTAIPQPTGTIQFAQLGPNVQFISSGPYAGYISSHVVPANSSPIGQRPHLDGYTTTLISPGAKGEQQFQIGLSPAELAPVSLPSSPQVTSQYIQLDSRTPLTVSGAAVSTPGAHLQLHPHAAVLPQTLTLAPSQLVVQYADGSAGKKPEVHAKGVLNGELEVVKQMKAPTQPANHQQVQSYETRHILVPAEYGQNPAGLQTSLVLVAQPNHSPDQEHGSNKISLVTKSVTPHTVIQTTLPPDELPASLYSSTQTPIIGYITSANQHAVSYHAALPQHLVIPSGQSLLIPVSPDGNQVSPALAPAPAPPALPSNPVPVVVAAPSPIPVSAPVNPPVPASIQASPTISSPSSPVALPPFFMRGSIIQLADGELKRVEDLKTEDFIQSAEISSELKIDSSTVERIDSGQSPNAVVIQFSVGELKAQVCVEVLVEYPFFVFGQGWSSCCPDRTTQLFELSCAKLCVGDVCVSLTLRGLRNGSLTDSQSLGASGILTKASGVERIAGSVSGRQVPTEMERNPGSLGGICGGESVLAMSETTHKRQGSEKLDKPTPCKIQSRDPDRTTVRKRRWSAPEWDQTGRVEGEPPLTLLKPSIISQEVKISIEGHSSSGREKCLIKL